MHYIYIYSKGYKMRMVSRTAWETPNVDKEAPISLSCKKREKNIQFVIIIVH